jgi:hypothetical protein
VFKLLQGDPSLRGSRERPEPCYPLPARKRKEDDRLAEGRKQAISLRLSAGDIRCIKKLAVRLGARDSDVVRFAIKMMLHRMLPLADPAVRGRGLVPVLAEWGPEAVRHFELDASTLDEIVNGDAPPAQRVDLEDISLLTMVSAQESYAKLRLRALTPPSKPPAQGDRRDSSPVNAMRRHLYGKYGFAAPSTVEAPPAGPDDAPTVERVRQGGRR